MTNQSATVHQIIPQSPSRLEFFGPPSILPGEDAAAYDNLLARVSGALTPSDIFEEMWVREIVDYAWDSLRYRRHLAAFLDSAIPKALEDVLQPFAENQPETRRQDRSFESKVQQVSAERNFGRTLATKWKAGDQTAIERVKGILVANGLTMDNVVAQAIANELAKIERFKNLIASSEARRDALLHEIERHRATFAQKARDQVRKIEDAEFNEVEPNILPVAANENTE